MGLRMPLATRRADEQERHISRSSEANQHKMAKPCDLMTGVNDAVVL